MRIIYDHKKYDIDLNDDGTMDTVITVTRIIDGAFIESRFDCEYASFYRRKNGQMTLNGLRQLGIRTLDDADNFVMTETEGK